MPKYRGLSPKQRKFINEYAKLGNGKQAAIKAGYSKKSAQVIASENLIKPIIKQQIDKTNIKSLITPEYVLDELHQALENCKQTDDNGNWIRATELFGKHLQMFSDRLITDVNINVNICNELQSLLGGNSLKSANVIDITPVPQLQITDNIQQVNPPVIQ